MSARRRTVAHWVGYVSALILTVLVVAAIATALVALIGRVVL